MVLISQGNLKLVYQGVGVQVGWQGQFGSSNGQAGVQVGSGVGVLVTSGVLVDVGSGVFVLVGSGVLLGCGVPVLVGGIGVFVGQEV